MTSQDVASIRLSCRLQKPFLARISRSFALRNASVAPRGKSQHIGLLLIDPNKPLREPGTPLGGSQ